HNITPAGVSLSDQVFAAQRDVILNAAKEGSCVIVGRCADYVLRNHPDLFTVFITADLEYRKKRAVEQYGRSPEKIEKTIRSMDKQRSRHYHFYTDRTWGDRSLYDMMLNSSRLGTHLCVELLVKAITTKQG
ncbi:MAG: cytidylate kinase-like family protein, partial [Clostridia bacterium]|nr:cytidylate kinase-like family protein [Clostridia bacterium]